MRDVYIVEAVRSPIGRRGGDLSTLHPADLLGAVLKGALDRRGIDPTQVVQVIGGCVSQVAEQSFNITRCAWLGQGLPIETAETTIDSQCGSGQQATSLVAALIGSGMVDVAVSCGLEMMSRLPIGASMKGGLPLSKSYLERYVMNSQFGAAQLIGDEFGITREDVDRFGLRSQELANAAWDAGHFDAEIIPIEAPIADAEGNPTEETQIVKRDGGLRRTSLEKLAALKPTPVQGQKLHTAGTSSQVSDGAAALVLASEEGARRLGVEPRARIVTSTIVGVDPVTMLKGPIPATQRVLEDAGLEIDEIDTYEVNEAFASVVLAWMKACHPVEERLNPQGGAIALGHPTGSTGARLLTTALHTLERIGGRYGLIAMCCGGGLGTGTIIERV
jgi:acetyl-CoA C-acetyltransferase